MYKDPERLKALDGAFLQSRFGLMEMEKRLLSVLPKEKAEYIRNNFLRPAADAIEAAVKEERYGDVYSLTH
jgi:hypothetical protein